MIQIVTSKYIFWFLCVAHHIIMQSTDVVYYTLYIPDKFVKHPKRDITLYFQFKSEVIFSIYRYVPIIFICALLSNNPVNKTHFKSELHWTTLYMFSTNNSHCKWPAMKIITTHNHIG